MSNVVIIVDDEESLKPFLLEVQVTESQSTSDGNLSSSAAASVAMQSSSVFTLRRYVLLLAVVISISCFVFYRTIGSLHIVHGSFINPSASPLVNLEEVEIKEPKLEDVLRKAATRNNNTVILTTLNEAWAAPGSVLDLFFESFEIGQGTRQLLNHLVIIALDAKAYSRCLKVHKHCFSLETEGVDFSGGEAYFMTPPYLKMMWRRIEFLRTVLELGYNFVFTDADVMWFRNPFPRFYGSIDFQIACDHYNGRLNDRRNRPNGGFVYVRSNNRTIRFYKFWYDSRIKYPKYHDQDVLNFIKIDPFLWKLKLSMRFLNTKYFGGFCEPSKDLNRVVTMHANCCFGLDSNLHDLRIMLQDWRDFMSLPRNLKKSSGYSWKVPQNCSLASLRRYNSTDKEQSKLPGKSQE